MFGPGARILHLVNTAFRYDLRPGDPSRSRMDSVHRCAVAFLCIYSYKFRGSYWDPARKYNTRPNYLLTISVRSHPSRFKLAIPPNAPGVFRALRPSWCEVFTTNSIRFSPPHSLPHPLIGLPNPPLGICNMCSSGSPVLRGRIALCACTSPTVYCLAEFAPLPPALFTGPFTHLS